MRQPQVGAAGLALAAVLLLCAVVPPEIRGVGLAAAAAFIAIAAVASSDKAAAAPASIWCFALVTISLAAIRTGLAPGEGVEPVACLLLAAFAGIAAAGGRDNDEMFARIFAALVALAGARALYETFFGLASAAAQAREAAPGVVQTAIINRLEQGRPYAGFVTPAALACFFIMTVPPVAAWALGKRGQLRALGLAAASIGAAGLVATRSVSALAALAGALLLASLRGRLAFRTLAIAAGVIVLAVVGAGLLRPDAVFAPSRGDSPWRLRAGNVRIALAIAGDHPLAGVGPGGFAEAFPQYRREGDNESRHAHDLPAELMAEWGVPLGLALSAVFFWLFVAPVMRPGGEARSLSSGLTIGVAAFALHNLADFTAFLPSLLILAAISRGMLARRAASELAGATARGAWVALVVSVAAVAALSGLSRDALYHARTAAALGDHARALALASRADRLAPWDADPPQLAAEASMAMGATTASAATVAADRAVRLGPSRSAARFTRARARAVAGDTTGAYADLVEAARLYPMRTEYAAQAGALQASLAKAGEAAPR